MHKMMTQLGFDGKRLILRNGGFVFFSLLMPTAFYILFTKMMPGTNAAQAQSFNVEYMGSMIVYSILISTMMGMAIFLINDRDQGLQTLLKITNRSLTNYYFSIGLWSVLKNLMTIVVLGVVAVVINQVDLAFTQWASIMGWVLLGQLPILLVGTMLASVKRSETVTVLSNLITFPVAIISGLWWPLGMLPDWVQKVGKVMPTYFLNDLISRTVINAKMNWNDVIGIVFWILGLLVVIMLMHLATCQRSGMISE